MSDKRTMDDEYGDGSDHECCPTCGSCMPCDGGTFEKLQTAKAEITRLRAELEGARRDMERYRWLRGLYTYDAWSKMLGPYGPVNSPKGIDEAIDAAIAREKGEI